MKKRADLCPSEADALRLWVTRRFFERAARVPKVPERREGRWGPSQLVETDFEAFYTEYHFPRETRFRLPSANETPYTDGVKGEMCFFEAPLKSGHCTAMKKRADLCPSEADALLSMAMWVTLLGDLPEAAGGVEVHSGTISSSGALPSITPLVMETPLEEPRTSGAVVIGDFGISALDLANESTIPAVDVAGGSRSFPFLQTICPTSLNEEMMEDALRAPRHAKIDRLTRSLSHCVSLVAALDAAELKHDEELESSRLKLRKLEGDLESQRKLVEELRTVARGTHLQMQTYEARVMDLERDIASRDTEVAELRQTVDGLEQGRVDFELSLSREKAELLQRLSDSCASSSKREEALRTELVGLRRAMREAADSFAAEKRGLEEARTGLTLHVAELSAVPAFPGDPAVLARRCIGVAMAVLEVAYLREGSRFQVRKEGRGKEIYERLVETLGTRGIHLPPGGDETL
ncbi:hypothetical protein CJ030_MR4G025772 [Morella rubra]|uniref:Uncharacterized protein n=1 Tax=Morella rubra TaxID=262757 RepID=A0A6A1VUK5_9ROSI|nr:hypothetical protein CJ030_MR4G025772 [Morella rubra]